jgi:hypothetical protein
MIFPSRCLRLPGAAGADWLQRLTVFACVGLEGQAKRRCVHRCHAPDRHSFHLHRAGAQTRSSRKTLPPPYVRSRGGRGADWNRGNTFKANDLAKQLAKYRIHPQKVSIGTDKLQGYRVDAFEDAWARYCPVPPQFFAGTSELSAPLLAKGRFRPGSGFRRRGTLSGTVQTRMNKRRVPAVSGGSGSAGTEGVEAMSAALELIETVRANGGRMRGRG